MDVAANPMTKAKQMTAAPRMCLLPDIAMIFCHRSVPKRAIRVWREKDDFVGLPSPRVPNLKCLTWQTHRLQRYLDLCANDLYSQGNYVLIVVKM
jgi:hypothetical protein